MPEVRVHFAMRYGNPGIATAMDNMAREGCTRILAAPLYPQYCAATTATANDAVFGALARMRVQPALRTLPPYYDERLYIDALRAIAHRQAEALRGRLPDVSVHYAMRYGNPGIAAAIRNMMREGCTRILAAPLYPQYCAATTATANDAVFAALARVRWQPALRTLPPYYDDPLYIDALARTLTRQLAALDFTPDRLLLSFHGMPVRTLDLGDPYHCHCKKTARLLGEALRREVDVAFQSRFGRARWLEPATDATLADYPKHGVKRVAVAAPGFSADCIETLEELGIRGRRTFMDAGGEMFALLDCLNDSPEGMDMLTELMGRELAGWLAQA